MTDKDNPEDKPSLFDFSEEEARSWPPSDSYEAEDDADVVESDTSDEEPQEDLLAEESSSSDSDTDTTDTDAASDGDYVDMLFNDFSSFDGKEESPDEPQDDILTPVDKSSPADDLRVVGQSGKLKVLDDDENGDDEEARQLDEILDSSDEDLPAPEEEPASTETTEAAEIPSPTPEPETPAVVDEEVTSPEPEPEADDSAATLDDITPFAEIPADTSGEPLELEDDIDEIDIEALSDEPVAEQAIIEDYDSGDEEFAGEEVKPFRTYSSLDYGEEAIGEEAGEAAAAKQGIQINRNVMVLILAFLLVGGYFGFNAVFNRKYEPTKKRQRRLPKKDKRILASSRKELMPVWEITRQKGKSWNQERKLIKTIYTGGGRDNPFAMPDSVIADLKRAAELELLRKQKPNSYRRKAYRATLVGVLTSKENTIALINYQEAVFDILEGTSKPKILKLATKSMDKAKKNTQEMIVGSYIGPWQIIKLDSPEDAFTEAKVHIEYDGETKILSMGRAEELGIFTEDGEIDNLEEPHELSLDDFDW